MVKKKACIVTWFKNGNYGTILQAYATQEVVKKYGYEAVLLGEYGKFKFFNRPLYLLKKIINYSILRFKKPIYYFLNDSFIKQNINYVNLYSNRSKKNFISQIDVFISGGDQIWNPNYLRTKYLLSFVETNNKISYGTSFGVNEIPAGMANLYYSWLSKYRFIGVREASGVEIIRKLNLQSYQVCDPVFLLSKDEWDMICEQPKFDNYILCYFVGDIDKHMGLINFFAQKYRCQVINIKMSKYNIPNVINLSNVDVPRFLGLIKHAKLVLTDSFHSTCFSVIYEKDFYVFKRFLDNDPRSQNSRIYNLLEKLKISNRIINEAPCQFSDLNYDDIKRLLSIDIEFSENILRKNILDIK